MGDIYLSPVSTDQLLRELSSRLVGTELKVLDREDRWKAPEQIDVIHAVLKLLAQPRLVGDGDWPTLSGERLHDIDRVFGLIRAATMEPDADGDHVLRIHYEDRNEGYLAVEPFSVPHDILTAKDLKTAQYALKVLGKSVNRIASAVSLSFDHFVKTVELSDGGQKLLDERNEKKANI
jgi:hypothetical protein